VNGGDASDEFFDLKGSERANYAMFLMELCELIGVQRPDPAGEETERNDYVFGRARFPASGLKSAAIVLCAFETPGHQLSAVAANAPGGQLHVKIRQCLSLNFRALDGALF
jgi:hypothetical protein